MDIEAIYKEYHDKVLYYIRGKVNNQEDAEDICADVFLKIQKKKDEYDDKKAAVSTWIYTIARNAVIDFYRCNHVGEELSEDLVSDDSIDEEILKKETLSELADAVKKLSEEERTVILMHYYEDLSLKEIEQKTGMSYGQVKLRHNSALKEMEKFFSKKTARSGFRVV